MADSQSKKPTLFQVLFAEFFGTFVLTFVDSAAGLLDFHGLGVGGILSRSLAPAAVVISMIFLIGEISGAHINPAVTLGFALRRVFPWRKVPLYIGVQVLGAFVAGLLLWLLFGAELHNGLSLPKEGVQLALVFEILLSWFLITAVLASSSEASIKGWESAFPVGVVLIFCGLIGKIVSGSSMNPARSLGPAIVAGELGTIWIYLVAPATGAGLAVLTAYLLMGPPCAKEVKAAEGS